MIPRFVLLFAFCLFGSGSVQAMPRWASLDGQRMGKKGILKIVCSGTGPSVGLARKDALNDCWTSAAHELSSDISVKSLSASSERQVLYQQEVLNRSRVGGLACTVRRETVEQTGDQLTVWLLCEFDLSKAKAIPASEDGLASDFAVPVELPIAADSRNRVVVTLATVPRCEDVTILGKAPARVLPCDRNPMPVLIDPEDNEILVRARDHYPKSVFLGPHREARGYVQVVLQSR